MLKEIKRKNSVIELSTSKTIKISLSFQYEIFAERVTCISLYTHTLEKKNKTSSVFITES